MNDLATALKVLADPTRLAILDFLRDPQVSCCSREDGVCACDLESFLGVSQPTVSHHMRQLVDAGFVTSQKRGRWVYYALEPAAFETLLKALAPFANAPVVA